MTNTNMHTRIDQISASDFLKGYQFRDCVIQKVNDLNPADATHQSLERNVRILLDMIEESRLQRYTQMPLVLFSQAIVELDRFVRVDDENPDTQIGGYLDDLLRLKNLCDEYRDELSAFLSWKKSHFNDYQRSAPTRVDLASYGR